MCGIAGYFCPKGITPENADLGLMRSIQFHRGPDGEGSYYSTDKRFQTTFVRLAIIDLDTGNQPLVDRKHKRVLVGNGEIYNFLELQEHNVCRDYPFQTKGDMETVLALISKVGDDFIYHLNGMYALAVYNERKHQLQLVRDRLGIKPLYWAPTSRGGIIFASEIKALFASGLIESKVNETAVTAYLRHGYVPGPQTIFDGIEKIMPGERLIVSSNGDIKKQRYWNAAPHNDIPKNSIDVRNHLRELLEDSIKLQMRADVPIGLLLSGGIDSGIIAALASKYSAGPLNTYSVRFEGAEIDETPLARLVAEKYGTNHSEITIPVKNVADFLPALAWHCDEPQNDPALLPNAQVEKELGKNLKVALNGTGGDELFCGYGRYFQLGIERAYQHLPEFIRRDVVERITKCINPMSAFRLGRAAHWDTDPGRYIHDHSTLFPDPILKLIGHRPMDQTARQSYFARQFSVPHQTRMLIADINTYLVKNLLTLLDRTSMAYGVEARVPFLDHRLVEFALAVPPKIRTPENQQKGLERELAENLLPQKILQAPKRGFAAPAKAWARSGLAKTAQRFLTRPQSLERGWWTADGIKALAAKPERFSFQLYALLMLELTVYLHIENIQLTKPSATMDEIVDAAQ